MPPAKLDRHSLELLLSFVLPAGCQLSLVSQTTYRINCPNFDIAHQVWQNAQACINPLLEAGSVVEVVAADYYARSHPKL